jgi:hypothetical protein
MKRSGIREFSASPDFATLHPGYSLITPALWLTSEA